MRAPPRHHPFVLNSLKPNEFPPQLVARKLCSVVQVKAGQVCYGVRWKFMVRPSAVNSSFVLNVELIVWLNSFDTEDESSVCFLWNNVTSYREMIHVLDSFEFILVSGSSSSEKCVVKVGLVKWFLEHSVTWNRWRHEGSWRRFRFLLVDLTFSFFDVDCWSRHGVDYSHSLPLCRPEGLLLLVASPNISTPAAAQTPALSLNMRSTEVCWSVGEIVVHRLHIVQKNSASIKVPALTSNNVYKGREKASVLHEQYQTWHNSSDLRYKE